jgi:putative cardiolipin synthase
MHNKLFIADGAMAVMGGRNVADEYFARSATSNFVDMDVLVVGDVVPRLSSIFDAYWNSRQAYPVSTILGESADVDEARRSFNHLVEDGDQMMSVKVPQSDMMGHRLIGTDLDSGRLELAWEPANAFADQPAKVMATSAERARAMSVQMNVMDRVAESKREVVISSLYFVPGTVGVDEFADLRRRGVKVIILTNSLAANDVPLVHIGYARALAPNRRRALRAESLGRRTRRARRYPEHVTGPAARKGGRARSIHGLYRLDEPGSAVREHQYMSDRRT